MFQGYLKKIIELFFLGLKLFREGPSPLLEYKSPAFLCVRGCISLLFVISSYSSQQIFVKFGFPES